MIPVRHDLVKILFEYLKGAGLENADKDSPLLRSAIRKTGKLTDRGMHPGDICQMVKRRLRDAGLPTRLSPHSFRVATITDLLEQGLALEDVQRLAGHADPRTTRLYDRRNDKIDAVIDEEAMVFLSNKLSTPLQFETYLTRSFEEGFRVGQKPVTVAVIEGFLAKDINELEPRLTRQGYNAKVLAEVLHARPGEIRALLRGQLASGRAQELQHEMLAVGIPL